MKSQMKQCACITCKKIQNQVITYEEAKCNHVGHGILTLITGLWDIVWLIMWNKSREDAENNMRLALTAAECDDCGGKLMIIS